MGWENEVKAFFKTASRIIIIGIGSELRSDDYAGVIVARILQKSIKSPRVKIIEAESVPESYTKDIVEFNPTHVLFIDTAIMGLTPGSAKTFAPSEILGITMSSHKPEFSMMIDYLEKKIKADYLFLGLQPKHLAVDGDISTEVSVATKKIAHQLSSIIEKVMKSIDDN